MNKTVAMTIALARKKRPLVMTPLLLESEPYTCAQLQVMRGAIADRRKKNCVSGKIRKRRSRENRLADQQCGFLAIDNRIADINPHGYSPYRIELDNSANIQSKSGVGVSQFEREANRG